MKHTKFKYLALGSLLFTTATLTSQTALAQDLTAEDKPDQNQKACNLDKESVAKNLSEGLSVQDLQQELANCLPEAMQVPAPTYNDVKYNVGYEEMTGCGYHPQAKSFHCAMNIKRRYGYGSYNTNPPQAFGTFEWVTVCVNNGAGYQKVGTSGVHLHDEHLGNQPNWAFGVEIPVEKEMYGTQYGLGRPLDQRTLKAKAILSWAAPVNSCNQIPVWGNVLHFKIRLDV